MKFLQLSFVTFVGEELTVFGSVREECEKTLRTTDLNPMLQHCCCHVVAVHCICSCSDERTLCKVTF